MFKPSPRPGEMQGITVLTAISEGTDGDFSLFKSNISISHGARPLKSGVIEYGSESLKYDVFDEIYIKYPDTCRFLHPPELEKKIPDHEVDYLFELLLALPEIV